MLKISCHLWSRQNFVSYFLIQSSELDCKSKQSQVLLYIKFKIQLIFSLLGFRELYNMKYSHSLVKKSNNHEILRKSQGRLKSMTDLIGMEVRSERTTLIKTGDWSPDLLWARRGSVWWEFQRTEIDWAWTAAAGKMPSFSQSLHRISSPLPVYCCTPSLHFSIKGDSRWEVLAGLHLRRH